MDIDMDIEQNTQNPDVNSPDPDSDPARSERNEPYRRENNDVERPGKDDSIPVPPDSEQKHPVEDPPVGSDVPLGDVDDSPMRV